MVIGYAPDPVENARRINNIINEFRNSHPPIPKSVVPIEA
jgi:hypothetical protein